MATGSGFRSPLRSALAILLARATPVAKSAQRRTKCIKRTWFSMAAAAHGVTVAVGALECPFGPSWPRK